jgi:hypothetical protein
MYQRILNLNFVFVLAVMLISTAAYGQSAKASAPKFNVEMLKQNQNLLVFRDSTYEVLGDVKVFVSYSGQSLALSDDRKFYTNKVLLVFNKGTIYYAADEEYGCFFKSYDEGTITKFKGNLDDRKYVLYVKNYDFSKIVKWSRKNIITLVSDDEEIKKAVEATPRLTMHYDEFINAYNLKHK